VRLSDATAAYLLYKASHCSPNTIATDTVILGQFRDWLGDVAISDITSEHIRAYLSHHTQRGLSPYTVKRHHALLSAFWSWLCDPDIALCDRNPTSAVSPPKLPQIKPRALTRAQIESLVEATTQGRNPRRDKALLAFLIDSCARASEVCGVDLSDVDLQTGKTLLRHTKGSRERFVYLGRRSRLLTLLYTKTERPQPADPDCNRLFLTFDGYAMTRHTLRSLLRRLGDRTGIHVSAHMFRHAGAVERLKAGMSVASLQRLLGHSQLSTTARYLTSLQDETVQAKAERTSPSDIWRL
jgi:integrase/recombinase XerD